MWGPSQEEAFSQVKAKLTKPTVLTLYNPTVPTKVLADVLSYGIDAILLQQVDDIWKPIAYGFESHERNRKAIHSNRKRSFGCDLDLQKVFRLRPRSFIPDRDGSQTTCTLT